MVSGKRGLWLRGRDVLLFAFGEPAARSASVCFHRMLRVPDGDYVNACPVPLGTFPLELVDDHADRLPSDMVRRGGVMLPVYPFEALRITLYGGHPVPFAAKVGAGKINVLTGASWTEELQSLPQDYLVVTHTTDLEGFYVDRGIARQFVAAELGASLTAEEQITSQSSVGGLQIAIHPLNVENARVLEAEHERRMAGTPPSREMRMGFMPGGRLDQKLFSDRFGTASWVHDERLRCFVHLVPFGMWHAYTGKAPPPSPVSPKTYADAGLPMDPTYLHAKVSLPSNGLLARLKSVGAFLVPSHARSARDDTSEPSTIRAVPESPAEKPAKR